VNASVCSIVEGGNISQGAWQCKPKVRASPERSAPQARRVS
jgi:hypothetical protein